jgi:hypothetical protein
MLCWRHLGHRGRLSLSRHFHSCPRDSWECDCRSRTRHSVLRRIRCRSYAFPMRAGQMYAKNYRREATRMTVQTPGEHDPIDSEFVEVIDDRKDVSDLACTPFPNDSVSPQQRTFWKGLLITAGLLFAVWLHSHTARSRRWRLKRLVGEI